MPNEVLPKQVVQSHETVIQRLSMAESQRSIESKERVDAANPNSILKSSALWKKNKKVAEDKELQKKGKAAVLVHDNST